MRCRHQQQRPPTGSARGCVTSGGADGNIAKQAEQDHAMPKKRMQKKKLEDVLRSVNSHVVTPTEHNATMRNVLLALVVQRKK